MYLSITPILENTTLPRSQYYNGILESGKILEDSGNQYGISGYKADGTPKYFSFKQIDSSEIFVE